MLFDSSTLTGLTGAATAFCTATQKDNNEKFVASVSLDRFLRVHETASIHRKLIDKAYLKQRLTTILVDEDYEVEKPPTEEQEDDEIWNSMSVASSKRKNRS
jgi:ribosome biogenesis protein NSA1